MRESDKLNDGRQSLKAKVVFSALKINDHPVLRHRRQGWGHWVYVSALRLEAGKFLIGITNHRPQQAIADYGKRWGIETLFGGLKTRGFCLESTHLQDPQRLSRMIALLTIALCWAFLTGQWWASQQAIGIKKHGRKAKSFFRHGFDHLREILFNLESRMDELFQVLTLVVLYLDRELLTIKNESSVNNVSFSSDSKTLVVGYNDNTIKLLDAETGRELRTLQGQKGGHIRNVSFSPNGKILASISDGENGTIKLWLWNLDRLMQIGCSQLRPYLIVTHPEARGNPPLCQDYY